MEENIKAKARAIAAALTDKQKAQLVAGADFWHLTEIKDPESDTQIGGITLTDGPHGLRKQTGGAKGIGLGKSVPATCFPTACATACSFDRDLLKELGAALADECRSEDVAVILGPGANIKRHPLCGRNFEYFSEDPYLTGALAASYIEGVQSKGVGVSLKHFAVNNQEKLRFVSDSVTDERALREIYLAGFEYAVKQAKPWSVMCSYNRINGVYASENKKLLTDILRDEWGFDGLVMSDWGAVSERVKGIAAGLDLQMPGPDAYNEKKILEALKNGELNSAQLDKCCENIIALMLKAGERKPFKYSAYAHHTLARKFAAESAVLLKNDGALLPGNTSQKAALIGAYAKTPRYQGSGSSKIAPTKLENAYDELLKLGLVFDYAQGYKAESEEPDGALIDQACQAARGKDIVYIFASLTSKSESEGFDRKSLSLPKAQTELIERVSRVNDNVCVILSGGGVIDLSWQEGVKAIVMCHLGGQAGAGAAADILLGKVNPSGKLAESWPMNLEDVPSNNYFPGKGKTTQYRESIYVGYRYYDSAEKQVRYPFGYGLSYASFEITSAEVSSESFNQQDNITLSCKVKNTSSVDGACVVQLYVKPPKDTVFRPEHELKGFDKAFLKAGEEKQLKFTLDERAFSYYDVKSESWRVSEGEYKLQLGFSSRDIKHVLSVTLQGDGEAKTDMRADALCYYEPQNGLKPDDASFAALFGGELPENVYEGKKEFDINSTLKDISAKPLGRAFTKIVKKQAVKIFKNDPETAAMTASSLDDMPLRSLAMSGGKMTRGVAAGIAELMNGHIKKALELMKE